MFLLRLHDSHKVPGSLMVVMTFFWYQLLLYQLLLNVSLNSLMVVIQLLIYFMVMLYFFVLTLTSDFLEGEAPGGEGELTGRTAGVGTVG